MENTIVPLSTIDPNLLTWTAIVQVIEIKHVIHIGEPQTSYQQYALADKQISQFCFFNYSFVLHLSFNSN